VGVGVACGRSGRVHAHISPISPPYLHHISPASPQASIAVVGAVESMRLARGLKLHGQPAAHAAQMARVITKLMSRCVSRWGR
jgi:hypothetical protein